MVRRLDDMEGALGKVREDFGTDLKRLRLEWDDVLDRLERLAGRVAKREQRDTAVLTGPSPGVDGARPPVAPVASGAMAAVLKRRGVR